MSPPCSRRIFWLTGKPRPVPRAPLRDSKTEKIRLMSTSSIPSPLSSTITRTLPTSTECSVDTITRPGSDDSHASIAFVTTFRIARCSNSGSNSSSGIDSAAFLLSSTPTPWARTTIKSSTSATTSFMSDGTRSGSRSLLKVSMSITRLEIFSWFLSTIDQPLRTMSLSSCFSPSSIK